MLVDVVFDVRTGYPVIAKPAGHFNAHPFGEGNPLIFCIIRMDESNVPKLWDVGPDGHVPVLKLDLGKFIALQRPTLKVTDTPLFNVWKPGVAQFVTGSRDDWLGQITKLDVFKNAILTVGTGKTYATISAAVTAASSGDTIAVYSNATNIYTENVDVQKCLQIVGMVANRGLTITQSLGIVVQFSFTGAVRGACFENFKVVATGTATMAVDAWYSAYALTIRNVEMVGGTTAACRGYVGTRFINCLARDAAVGFYTDQLCYFLNCTAVDNTTYGFQGGNNAVCYLCISAGNGTADYYQIPAYSSLNTSADGTAPGSGSVTGFLTSDFVDYAGNDFRIRDGARFSTLARFLGYPRYPFDAFGQLKKALGYVYAGWHDPDPNCDIPIGMLNWRHP